MQIVDKLLPKNDFSRTGKSLAVMDAVVIHNLGVPGQRALVAREYWAGLANQDAMDSKPDISASAHYIIDFDGVIYRTIPENERAYHVGSSVKDPVSGRVYTDLAREVFGAAAENPDTMSPNRCCLGVELCHGEAGEIPSRVLAAAVELVADILTRYKRDPFTHILTHEDVVGWKRCPLWFSNHPDDFKAFKKSVAEKMGIA